MIFVLAEIRSPPVLHLKERVYKVRENEDVTFTVPFSGTPKPDAEWTVSDTVIKNTPRKKKTLGEDAATLTIKKVVDEDAGEYTIRLKNPVGDVAASLQLIILSEFSNKSTLTPETEINFKILFLHRATNRAR